LAGGLEQVLFPSSNSYVLCVDTRTKEKKMNHKKVILRFDEYSTRSHYLLRRLEGTATVDSMIRLIDQADLEANPRDAKAGSVTDAIQETLETSPELFPFKSKGLLLAAGECRDLKERNRFELSFENGSLEGVLDGGHNLLAIGTFLLKKAVGDEGDKLAKKIKRWDDLMNAWIDHRDAIDQVKDKVKFFVPVEVVYPHEGPAGRANFDNAILEVASARNNNAELTETTKANKAGLYEFIRTSIDPSLVKEIEWKTNDGGRIKVQDLVALSWVALSKLDDETLMNNRVSGTQTYSSKGACVNAFNKLLSDDAVSRRVNCDIRELHHPGVKSAIKLMKDLPRLYDLIYKNLPDAYNSVSPRFGGIDSVRTYDPVRNQSGNGKNTKYLKHPPLTKYFKSACKYDYPEGFIAPLVWALGDLMEVKDGMIDWIAGVNPDNFIQTHLAETMKVFYGMIQMSNWDSQVIGKTSACYELMSNDFRGRLPR
jgi:hypothetical protein